MAQNCAALERGKIGEAFSLSVIASKMLILLIKGRTLNQKRTDAPRDPKHLCPCGIRCEF